MFDSLEVKVLFQPGGGERGPMDKNRIEGLRRWASEQVMAKPVSTKGAGGKSGGRA
jgi:hypothetical protein